MAKTTSATITIETSSHPDYDLFATLELDNGRKTHRRGNRGDIDVWVASAQISAAGSNIPVRVVDRAR